MTSKALSPSARCIGDGLDEDGFVSIDRDRFGEAFARDVDPPQAETMAVVQKPVAKKCFGVPVAQAAWKSKPAWFLSSENDRHISPDLQHFMTKPVGAKVVSVGRQATPHRCRTQPRPRSSSRTPQVAQVEGAKQAVK